MRSIKENKLKGLSDRQLIRSIKDLKKQTNAIIPQKEESISKPVGTEEISKTPKWDKGFHKSFGIGDVELVSMVISSIEQAFSHFNLPEKMNRIEIASLMLAEMKPQNETECLLAAQMLGVHHAAIAFLKAANFGRSPEVCESYTRQSVRLMRLFTEQLEAMAKLKGKNREQKMIVEHVHVHQGGQAIVGTVNARKEGKGGGGNEQN